MGKLTNTVRVMVKPLSGGTIDAYLRLVARDRPTLLISVHPLLLQAQGLTPADVFAWLGAAGYAHRIIAEDHEVHVLATPAAR